MRAGADERAIGEAGLEPLFPDPAHRPAAVVDRMIGLNRRDDALFSESRQRVRLHMLDMLDAKAAVSRAVGVCYVGHVFDHFFVRLVSYRVRVVLQSRLFVAFPPASLFCFFFYAFSSRL